MLQKAGTESLSFMGRTRAGGCLLAAVERSNLLQEAGTENLSLIKSQGGWNNSRGMPVCCNREIYHSTKGRDGETVPYQELRGGGTRARGLELPVGRSRKIQYSTKSRDGEPVPYQEPEG